MEKSYCFPSITLLRKSESKNTDEGELIRTARRIQETLLSFGLKVSIVNICTGTRFTRYEIQPEIGIRVRDIANRENDIKIALNAEHIHIEAPIQGKAAIGIDVANKENGIVTIREMIESEEFCRNTSQLTIPIGRDITGNPVFCDISQMPHLFIGGTTGSGKSVFIDSMIMGIIYKSYPDSVKILMIDTKGVGLTVYNGLPHMLIPVVTDAKKSLGALKWCLEEIHSRCMKFSKYSVRDLKAYNNHSEIEYRLPQILVIIDDLSDLMAIYKSEAEELIAQIARLSRGTGMHLVIATQRPSADVVTGLIKANIPSRIAFSTFSAMDSRVILDEKGAEELLGNGDMLFKQRGCLKSVRIQGTYVSDKEISDVVGFLKAQFPNSVDCFNSTENKKDIIEPQTYDAYFTEAGRLVIDKDKASIGTLQRELKIGFNRASRIMNELCEAGVVGEELGTKPRKILMTINEFESLYFPYIEIEKKQKENISEERPKMEKGGTQAETDAQNKISKKNSKEVARKKGNKKKKFNFGIICVCIGFLMLFYVNTKEDEDKSNQYENDFDVRDSEDTRNGINECENSQEEKYTNEIEIVENTSRESDAEDLELYGNLAQSPFPRTEEYIVNNTLLKYNEIAEFPIDSEYIEHIISVERPLSKTTYTLSNGVYFIIQYNDYNRVLFIDYQEESNDDTDLYAVLRDMIKAVNPEIQDDEIQTMWEELKTNEYSNYYGDKYEIGGFGINFSSNKLNNGQTRYLIKTEYPIK